jgi:hypothetical protein
MSAQKKPAVGPLSDDYYELRLYQCVPGRLPDLHYRMSVEIPPLFARHGVVRPLAYWDGFAGPMTPLYAYILRWKNLDERMAAFTSFYADAEWARLRRESNAGKQMVERIDVYFLKGVTGWEAVNDPKQQGAIGGLHELRLRHTHGGNVPRANKTMLEVDLPAMRRHGATSLGLFNMWMGGLMPQVLSLVAWPDEAARAKGIAGYDADPAIRTARATERRELGRSLFNSGKTYLLRPAEYGTAQANLSPLP